MLNQKMLVDIFQLFCGIRTYSQQENELRNYIVAIEEMHIIVNDFGNELQKDIFTYCFNILKTAIERQNHVFLFDFADAVHNLPEIFYPDTHWGNTPKSSLETFWKLFIQPLRRKHGKHLFNDFKHVFIK